MIDEKERRRLKTSYTTAMAAYPAGLNLGGEIVGKINK